MASAPIRDGWTQGLPLLRQAGQQVGWHIADEAVLLSRSVRGTMQRTCVPRNPLSKSSGAYYARSFTVGDAVEFRLRPDELRDKSGDPLRQYAAVYFTSRILIVFVLCSSEGEALAWAAQIRSGQAQASYLAADEESPIAADMTQPVFLPQFQASAQRSAVRTGPRRLPLVPLPVTQASATR